MTKKFIIGGVEIEEFTMYSLYKDFKKANLNLTDGSHSIGHFVGWDANGSPVYEQYPNPQHNVEVFSFNEDSGSRHIHHNED